MLWCSSVAMAENDKPPVAQPDPAVIEQVENDLNNFADKLRKKKGALDQKKAFGMLKDHIKNKPHIYGAAFAYAPAERQGKRIKSSPYVYRSEGKFIEKDLIESYDYEVEAWYAEPVKQGRAVWSAPYFDEGGGEVWMITYSIPIYTKGDHPALIGVVTSDVFLSE